MGRQVTGVGIAGRAGDRLVAVVHQGDELANLLGNLISLRGWPRLLVLAKGIANEKIRIGGVGQALMGRHGPKDVLKKL